VKRKKTEDEKRFEAFLRSHPLAGKRISDRRIGEILYRDAKKLHPEMMERLGQSIVLEHLQDIIEALRDRDEPRVEKLLSGIPETLAVDLLKAITRAAGE
jgi:DNA-binding GntR family transcriptional regulator